MKKFILVVDDDRVNAELLQTYLSENGFDVSLAGSGEEAQVRIVSKRPDLIVLDLFLPDTKGSDFCAELRRNPATREIPVILCTAHQITFEEKMEGFRTGVDDYLIRPFELVELLARIEAVLRRTQLLPKPELLAGIEAVIQKPAPPEPRPAEAPPDPSAFPAWDALDTSFPTDTDGEPDFPEEPLQPVTIFRRMGEVLLRPRETFKQLKPHQDFLIALLLVVAAPVVASFSKLSQPDGEFDAWIGFFSLGLVTNVVMWLGTAGLLHLTAPFLGANLSSRRAMIVAGLSWAPRTLSALLAVFYALLSSAGMAAQGKEFSSGINLIPGLPASAWVDAFSRIGLFDVWAAWLTLMGLWTVCEMEERRWNAATILVGVVCLVFGALTTY